MNAMVKAHNAEIRALMQAALNGEIDEADAVRTIILLQRELIIALVSSQPSLSQAGSAALAGIALTEECIRLSKEAA